MSADGHGHNLGALAQWAGIVAVLLGQVHQCRTEDKEATKTSTQVSEMGLRVAELERSRMAVERVEEAIKGVNQRFDDFTEHVDRRFDDLKDERRRK